MTTSCPLPDTGGSAEGQAGGFFTSTLQCTICQGVRADNVGQGGRRGQQSCGWTPPTPQAPSHQQERRPPITSSPQILPPKCSAWCRPEPGWRLHLESGITIEIQQRHERAGRQWAIWLPSASGFHVDKAAGRSSFCQPGSSPSQELGASGAWAGAVAPWFVSRWRPATQAEAGAREQLSPQSWVRGARGREGGAESRTTAFLHGDLIRSPGVSRWCVGRWDPKQVLLSSPAPPQQRTGQGFSEQSNKDTQQEAGSAGTGGLDTHSGTPGSRALTDTPP